MGVSKNRDTPISHPKCWSFFSRKTHGFVGETQHFRSFLHIGCRLVFWWDTPIWHCITYNSRHNHVYIYNMDLHTNNFEVSTTIRPTNFYSSWWFQPLWTILLKMGSSSPILRVNIYLSCHHRDILNKMMETTSNCFFRGGLHLDSHGILLASF